MARVAALVADLMLASRVRTALEAAGHEVVASAELSADSVGGADIVVADLDAVAADRLAGVAVPVIAFYRHTDSAAKAAADAVGIEVAVPRSRMVRELPDLVSRALSA
jgi:hypothetical protein